MQAINAQNEDVFLGGFGTPLDWSMNFLYYLFPSFKRNLRRTFTTPLSPVLFVPDQDEVPPGARPVSYLSFHARVGHNSRFIGLSDDDYKELGGVEYRALTLSLWIVSGVSRFPFCFQFTKRVVYEAAPVQYYIAMMLIPFAVLSPYMSMSRWKDEFLPPNQHRVINPIWLVRAAMIRSCLTNCPVTTQVYRLSGCRRMGKHRAFAGRPKPGAFPDCIPVARIRDVVGARWQYWLCECAPT